MLEYSKETLVVSSVYVVSFFLTFNILAPIQSLFFSQFPSQAYLLFLPHGVRVLAAWLLGWNSIIAIAPGVLIANLLFMQAVPEAVSFPVLMVNILAAPAVFQALYSFGWKIAPRSDRSPCWPCVMVAGFIISVVTASLMNLLFGSALEDYIAYMIGDFFGLFFLMLLLMLVFRRLR